MVAEVSVHRHYLYPTLRKVHRRVLAYGDAAHRPEPQRKRRGISRAKTFVNRKPVSFRLKGTLRKHVKGAGCSPKAQQVAY